MELYTFQTITLEELLTNAEEYRGGADRITIGSTDGNVTVKYEKNKATIEGDYDLKSTKFKVDTYETITDKTKLENVLKIYETPNGEVRTKMHDGVALEKLIREQCTGYKLLKVHVLDSKGDILGTLFDSSKGGRLVPEGTELEEPVNNSCTEDEKIEKLRENLKKSDYPYWYISSAVELFAQNLKED